MENDELMHYGVKGMKWGVRKSYQSTSSSKSKTEKGKSFVESLSSKSAAYKKKAAASRLKKETAKKKKAEEKVKLEEKKAETRKAKQAAKDAKNSTKKGRKVSDMTEAELEARIKRLELEKRYSDLQKQLYPAKKNKAKEIAADILESSIRNVGKQYGVYILGTMVNKASAGVFKDERIINPKKGQKD